MGIYASGYVFGDMQIFLSIDTFREIYGVPAGISWLFVKADSAEHLLQLEQKLRALLGDVADIIAPTNIARLQRQAMSRCTSRRPPSVPIVRKPNG